MVRNIKLYKTRLRQKYRTLRENMAKDKKELMDKKVLDNLLRTQEYQESGTVLTYVSKDIEVDTYALINQSLKSGKRVAAPACSIENRSMAFYIINSVNDLEKGAFGLLEPNKTKCEKLTDLSQGVCIVPGFCFDPEGFRLGYGYGYYDRFLQNFGGSTIGVCYHSFIVPHLPHGRFDRPIDIMVTDRYVRKITL